MTHREAAEWRDAALPHVSLRDARGDGLTIQLRRTTTWSSNYSSWAAGDVVTVAGGAEKRRENVLMHENEPAELARLLRHALDQPKRDWTFAIFDDGMTLRIEGDGAEQWRVDCRPVAMPGPGDASKTVPAFEFMVTRSTIEVAISELATLSSALTLLQQKPSL